MLELLCLLVFAPLKWFLGKAVVRWDRAVDSWGPAGHRGAPVTESAVPEKAITAADVRTLQRIEDDSWWTPENEQEADSQRWLLEHGLVVDTDKGLVLTKKGQQQLL